MADVAPASPTLVPAPPVPLAPTTSVAPTPDEMHFFDRVKKHLGNKGSMTEFLKVCELFTSELISERELVARVHNFIGTSPELMEWFKKWARSPEEAEFVKINIKKPSGRVALTSCRALGPSYRLLPERVRFIQDRGVANF